MEYFIYLFLFLRTEYFSFIYKIEFNKWNTLILYIRLNLEMLVYIGLFGNLQLKQQLKITLLQILPNTLKLHFLNAHFKTATFSKTHFYRQFIQTDPKCIFVSNLFNNFLSFNFYVQNFKTLFFLSFSKYKYTLVYFNKKAICKNFNKLIPNTLKV